LGPYINEPPIETTHLTTLMLVIPKLRLLELKNSYEKLEPEARQKEIEEQKKEKKKRQLKEKERNKKKEHKKKNLVLPLLPRLLIKQLLTYNMNKKD